MKKINKKTLLETATYLMFEINEEQLNILAQEYEDVFHAFEEIKNLPEVDQIKPMFFPYSLYGELREDIPEQTLTQEEALKNAPKKKGGQIVLPKVVK